MSEFSDPFTALVDACSLAGALRRNLLLSLAEAGFYRVQWSERILQEVDLAIRKMTGGEVQSDRQINAMKRAFPEAMVSGFSTIENAIEAQQIPDTNDAHVIAAAVKAGVDVIVTENVRDFPEAVLRQYGLEAITADDFIADCIDLNKVSAMFAINKMRKRFNNPKYTWLALCEIAEARGLVQTATAMREYVQIFDPIEE